MNTRLHNLRRSCAVASLAALALLCAPVGHAQYDAVLPGKTTQMHFEGPVLVTMFQGKLDTRDAKAGDPVTLKVKKALKLKDLEIPSGSKVTGKITNVQSQQEGKGNASLGIQFESVELKDHKVMPIRGLIVGIGKLSSAADNVGYMGVMSRDGAGSTPGLDPSIAAQRNVDDVGFGSSLPGVAIAQGLNKTQTSEMRGINTNIKLDPSIMIKLELFRPNPAS